MGQTRTARTAGFLLAFALVFGPAVASAQQAQGEGRDPRLDFAGKLGSDIVSVAAGVVTFSGKRSGYGNLVEVNHGNGYATRYAHNSRNLVAVGDEGIIRTS